MIELSHTAEKTVKRYLHKTARKEKNMSIKMYVNGSDRKGHINPEIYGHFRSIWADVSITVSMSVRTAVFRTRKVSETI